MNVKPIEHAIEALLSQSHGISHGSCSLVLVFRDGRLQRFETSRTESALVDQGRENRDEAE